MTSKAYSFKTVKQDLSFASSFIQLISDLSVCLAMNSFHVSINRSRHINVVLPSCIGDWCQRWLIFYVGCQGCQHRLQRLTNPEEEFIFSTATHVFSSQKKAMGVFSNLGMFSASRKKPSSSSGSSTVKTHLSHIAPDTKSKYYLNFFFFNSPTPTLCQDQTLPSPQRFQQCCNLIHLRGHSCT